MGRFHINNTHFYKPLTFGEFSLYQSGRLYMQGGEEIGQHPHLNWFELTSVSKGSGTVVTNGMASKIEKGDVYLSFPCDIHNIISSTVDPLEYDFIAFYCDNEDIKKALDGIIPDHGDGKKRIFADADISMLITSVINETTEENTLSTIMMQSILTQIAVRTVRAFETKTDNADVKPKRDATSLCYKVMNYIDSHIFSITSLSSLASVFGYNYSYISDIFAKTTSFTIASYYSEKRLERAKLLLKEKRLTATEIASLLNYSSVYSFSKAYKNKFGHSPKST
ncbi:MAG: helix-turn-helix domain-containing protein [Clostridia bacterium]|nr:helix-turn-helix domain-containing protein [Clostridia bacterium]